MRADSLNAAPVYKMLVVGALALSVGLYGHRIEKHARALEMAAAPALQNAARAVAQSAPMQAAAAAGQDMANAVDTPVVMTRDAEIDSGENLADALGDAGVSDDAAAAAMNAVARVYPLKKLRAGQDMTLTFNHTQTADQFVSATFDPEDTREITVTRQANGAFTASLRDIPVIRQRFAARVVIQSSIFEAGARAGVPHSVMAELVHIYAHDVDFQRDVHPGDSFEVLYDQPRTAQGKAVGGGSIIYAALHVGDQVKPIYRVTFADKSVDYFDAAGHSVRRTLLRTPVANVRITSGFGMRFHPLLGYSRMHKGVDFGAPIGTPIFAAGSGTIEEIGFKSGFGRYIRIRHNAHLETVYGHMSRFNPHLYRGAHVNQGQVIAYVGMSGLATGPHLHFEVHVNGVAVNPLTVKMQAGRALEGAQLIQFKQGESTLRAEFNALLAKQQQAAVAKKHAAAS
ncbi:MAG: M23 family metallopeptidase [Alphaproteobacteria bacterium]|nr:M23 family metallopeptidase [Alphaproteobacteria bacterium]